MLQRSPRVVARLRDTVTPAVASVIPGVLVVAGLAALVVAAFAVGFALGWLVTGLACFVLEWRVEQGSKPRGG